MCAPCRNAPFIIYSLFTLALSAGIDAFPYGLIGGWAGLTRFPLTRWFIAEFLHNGAKTKLFPDQRAHGFGWINGVDLYPKSWKWKTMVEFSSFADAGAALDSDTQHPRCQTSPD